MDLEQQMVKLVETSNNPETIKILIGTIEANRNLIITGLGGLGTLFCSGFIFLLVWIRNISKDLKTSSEYRKEMDQIVIILNEIKSALLGDLNKIGVISRLFNLEKELKSLRESNPKNSKEK